MKLKNFLAFAFIATAIAAGLVPASSGQAGADDPLLSPLIDELAKQQAAIVENQTAIETKLAVIAEELRIARIFVGRGGGKTPAK